MPPSHVARKLRATSCAVATGTTINIPDAYADERFNRSFDTSSGYRTQTILCVPMRDATGEVTGVIQALNKRNGRTFDAEDEELLLALGAQAAGAIENALLHEEINKLFEGFVSASVVAIEARDPTTAGPPDRGMLRNARPISRDSRARFTCPAATISRLPGR